MVEKSNHRAEARGKEKPAEAGYGERGGGCCSALKHRASIGAGAPRAEDGAGSATTEAPVVPGGVREIDVFWRPGVEGELAYVLRYADGEEREGLAPGRYGAAPLRDPQDFVELIWAWFPEAKVVHWLGHLDRDDGCYGVPEEEWA